MLSLLLNRLLRLNPHCQHHLKPLIGKRLCIQFEDLPITVVLQGTDTAIITFINGDDSADIRVTGTTINLARLGLAKEPQSLLNEGTIKINGDLAVLLAFQNLIQKIDYDWEAKLAGIIGDAPAHAISTSIQKAKSWSRQNKQSSLQDITEYLQEEKGLLPPREAVEDFYDDLAELRQTIDRLSAKLNAIA